MKALVNRDYTSILMVFRQYYKNKNNTKYIYPIKVVSSRKYEFYYNGKWHDDLYGDITRKTIMRNIQNLFIKYNIMDDINITMEDFVMNQEFIYKLSDDKHKKDLFKHITEEVKINS